MRNEKKIKAKFLIYGLIIGISFTGMFYEARDYIQLKTENVELKRQLEEGKKDVSLVPVETSIKTLGVETVADAPVLSEGASDFVASSPPTPSISEIVDKVYILESSGGKNDSCQLKGLYNGYGYSQSTFSWRCYKTKEEVRSLVAEWFKEKLAHNSLETALCIYNRGIATSDCEYAQKFASL